MPFKVSDQHVEEFYMLGYTVFRSLLPPSLIADLRRECAKASQAVRAQEDEQAQRFQPVSKYVADLKPFQNYAELPELRDAIDKVLSPRHFWGDPEYMGVLIEPANASWCTKWHRDARNLLTDQEWEKLLHRYDLGCQVNCPLYDDPSTWFVPGSHSRGDTDGERAVAVSLTPPSSKPNEQSDEERERACIRYCRAMPNAVCLNLAAGDYALYRPVAWHLGNYVPYRKRATLHDAVSEPAAMEGWLRRLKQGKVEAPGITDSTNGKSMAVA